MAVVFQDRDIRKESAFKDPRCSSSRPIPSCHWSDVLRLKPFHSGSLVDICASVEKKKNIYIYSRAFSWIVAHCFIVLNIFILFDTGASSYKPFT